MDQLRSN